MGKPFGHELELISSTYAWAIEQDVDELHRALIEYNKQPLFVIGSGGSLSACYFAEYLCQKLGIVAKVMTPLELLYSKNLLHNANLLFISASGKNTDILFSFKTALELEPRQIISLCMTKTSPLLELSKATSIGKAFGYSNPAGKDGFLATNSLVAFFGILNKAFFPTVKPSQLTLAKTFITKLEKFIQRVKPDFTFTVLYAAPGKAVAFDLESKLAEAALADVLLSDYRNFGHGRHHWFAKRRHQSAVIALVTPEEKDLAEKTLQWLPKEVPVLTLTSSLQGPEATIELLNMAFHLVSELGKLQKIDPGKPGVPAFGSRLYRLSYQKLYNKKVERLKGDARMAILRKTGVQSLEMLSGETLTFWSSAYKRFTRKLTAAEFGSLVFDYDGTLCSSRNRYTGMDPELITEFIRLLNTGVIIGIATGRGKSVRESIQQAIPRIYWSQIIIGYYNGSDIGWLEDNGHPYKGANGSAAIGLVFDNISNYPYPEIPLIERKPYQITVEANDHASWPRVRRAIIQQVQTMQCPGILWVESSHSLDIIDTTAGNKMNIIVLCSQKAETLGKSQKVLCIGDRGEWPGNDFQLLSTEFSLSVDEVSVLPDSCWNLAPTGVNRTKATENYLSCLTPSRKGLKFALP